MVVGGRVWEFLPTHGGRHQVRGHGPHFSAQDRPLQPSHSPLLDYRSHHPPTEDILSRIDEICSPIGIISLLQASINNKALPV